MSFDFSDPTFDFFRLKLYCFGFDISNPPSASTCDVSTVTNKFALSVFSGVSASCFVYDSMCLGILYAVV